MTGFLEASSADLRTPQKQTEAEELSPASRLRDGTMTGFLGASSADLRTPQK
jgi:hypothetical protein